MSENTFSCSAVQCELRCDWLVESVVSFAPGFWYCIFYNEGGKFSEQNVFTLVNGLSDYMFLGENQLFLHQFTAST
jgi:hypothetical protein